jgi:hypothetical protein
MPENNDDYLYETFSSSIAAGVRGDAIRSR